MLRTRFTEMFGLAYPVMSAPMGMHSGGRLAGAVSAAGGLGSFGGTHAVNGPDWMEAEIATIRAVTDRPFAIGFITPFIPMFEPLFDASLDASDRPAAIAFAEVLRTVCEEAESILRSRPPAILGVAG